ncbi:hypothetical protein A6769_12685 [Nostoc punctiforme NIES-2108]|uniref:Uncharacterized protein n=1 Tax=Nostoc punctiforme NIES-2108 TaxID=1356359 RepID=A0A367RQZ0_NOSPU|nr:hypothetical protein A6769_12685 [Nostoc punctiforme NIES-2108]
MCNLFLEPYLHSSPLQGYGVTQLELPPLIPPMFWGETGKSSSLPFSRGGLGWGKIQIHQVFQTCVYTTAPTGREALILTPLPL